MSTQNELKQKRGWNVGILLFLVGLGVFALMTEDVRLRNTLWVVVVIGMLCLAASIWMGDDRKIDELGDGGLGGNKVDELMRQGAFREARESLEVKSVAKVEVNQGMCEAQKTVIGEDVDKVVTQEASPAWGMWVLLLGIFFVVTAACCVFQIGGDLENDKKLSKEKERFKQVIRDRLTEYRYGNMGDKPLFDDAVGFKSAQEGLDKAARRREDMEWHRKVFCGDLEKIPDSVKKELEEQRLPNGALGVELKARSLVMGWAQGMGGYDEKKVNERGGVTLVKELCTRLAMQGVKVDFNRPAQSVYAYLSRVAQEDARLDEVLAGAAEEVRDGVLKGGDGNKVLWGVRQKMEPDVYRKVSNELRYVKYQAEYFMRQIESVLPVVMKGLEVAADQGDGSRCFVFDVSGNQAVLEAATVLSRLTTPEKDALYEVVQRRGVNDAGFGENMFRSVQRGWNDVFQGGKSLLRVGTSIGYDAARHVKELFGGDGSALKMDATAVDEANRYVNELRAMATGVYRPVTKPEYGVFGYIWLKMIMLSPVLVFLLCIGGCVFVKKRFLTKHLDV